MTQNKKIIISQNICHNTCETKHNIKIQFPEDIIENKISNKLR